jgi:hypothetical protein
MHPQQSSTQISETVFNVSARTTHGNNTDALGASMLVDIQVNGFKKVQDSIVHKPDSSMTTKGR